MQNILSYTRHKLAHLLGWNQGIGESWSENGEFFVGFRCVGCGAILDVTKVYPPNVEITGPAPEVNDERR